MQAANMSYEIPLVLEIQKRPCLYNFNLPEYNRKDLLDGAWAEVATAINSTVYECKDKWKNIRSSFVRSLRTSNGKAKKPYYLSKYLQFIIPYLKAVGVELSPDDARSTPDTESAEESTDNMLTIKIESEYDNEQNIIEPLHNMPTEVEQPIENKTTSAKKKKRLMPMKKFIAMQRKQNNRLHTTTEHNAMKFFLLSLLPELDTMDEDQVRLFKIKVMMLIDEIKNNSSKVKANLLDQTENIRLQKRLINLLLRSLESKSHD